MGFCDAFLLLLAKVSVGEDFFLLFTGSLNFTVSFFHLGDHFGLVF
jgi:hypothetical protein